MEFLRDRLELLQREGEEPPGGGGSPLLEVDAGRGELDQPLEVLPLGTGGAEPEDLPLLVRLEVAAFSKGFEAARDAVGAGRGGEAQAFGRAARIRSISGTST